MPRLLIVDDEPGIRSLLSLAFNRAGFLVKIAANPSEAMALCDSERFDAILCYVQMPGMDGHSLIRWIADRHPNIRSILMSAYDLQCGNCPHRGRCELLRKPFLPGAAIRSVTHALGISAN